MAPLTRLSLVATLCFLGAVGVAQVTPSGNATSSAERHGNPTSIKVVVLKCSGKSGEFKVQPRPNNPDTVIFATHPSCPLSSITPDPPGSGFKFLWKDSDGNYVYHYDGTPIPPAGYPFKYTTIPRGGGTGVIK